MDISYDFVHLSNWVIKFLEGEYNDFDIVLEGIVGKNSLSLRENECYRTECVIKVIKYNTILCDGNVKILLETHINEHDMIEIGFAKECISCFRYGFPTNWIDLLEYVYNRKKEQRDLSLPNELFDVALENMDEYKNYTFNNAISLIDWDISLSLIGDDDFNIILNGTISDSNELHSDSKKITELINDREKINLVSCTSKRLYKLESMINFRQMREYGYTLEFIECFKYGFPNNWILLFDELFIQYKNSVNNFIFSRNLINEAIVEMEDFEQSQTFQERQNNLLKNVEVKHLHLLESKDYIKPESISPLPSSLISPHSLNKENSLPNPKIHSSYDRQISTHSILQTPGLPLIMSTPVVNKSHQIMKDGSSFNFSPIMLTTSLDLSKEKNVSGEAKIFVSSTNESNSDGRHQTTDFFALSNDFSTLSEVRKRRVDNQGKRKILSSPEGTPTKDTEIVKKSKKKVIKKRNLTKKKRLPRLADYDNLAKDINNDHDIQELFDATLGLSDLEHTTRGKFNFTDDSIVGKQISEDTLNVVKNESKNLVYYLPTGNHIYKTKPKPKKVEKKLLESTPFDFEKLVYEEIERNKASESYTLEEGSSF